MQPDVHSDNAYTILGVPRDADIPTIRRAFRKLAIKYHPDASPPDQKAAAATTFARINSAHEILKEPEKRKQYDALLDRGVTPDLTKEVSAQGQFAKLADIVGEIQGLDIDAEPPELMLAFMDEGLREMLLGSLIVGSDLRETVLDAIAFSGIVPKGFELPEGTLSQGVLATTELRVMVLVKFTHTWQEGNTQYTRTYWKSASLPHAALTGVMIHESGRAFTSYMLELRDEEKTEFKLTFAERPKLERLLLVTNVYKLPLRITTAGTAGDDTASTFFFSAIPGILWCLPFAFASLCQICQFCGSDDKDLSILARNWDGVFEWMNEYWLTTVAAYLTPALFAMLIANVFTSWSTGRAVDLFGELDVDYADGIPKRPGTGEGTSGQPEPAGPAPELSPHVAAPITAGPTAAAPPAAALDAAPGAEAAPTDIAPPEAVQEALDVALPDSVLDAFGAEPEPPPRPGPPKKKSAACPRCGHAFGVPAMVRQTQCPSCSQVFMVD